MSEYQYYEFRTLDRSLSEQQIRELRACSTRATITSTQFVNSYRWGDLRGDPRKWMEKYFDAFAYVANWGTHQLMFRFPRRWVDYKSIQRHCDGDAISSWAKDDIVVIRFISQDEGGDSCDDDGEGWLSSLVPLRDDIARGDNRALYLAWLASAQNRELSETDLEPPVPDGLKELTPSLKALTEFLRLDSHLVTAAAQTSSKMKALTGTKYENWIKSLSVKDKTEWLLRFASGEENRVDLELLKLYLKEHPERAMQKTKARSVKSLLTSARSMDE